jgi:hypothetical protein
MVSPPVLVEPPHAATTSRRTAPIAPIRRFFIALLLAYVQ